MKQLEIREGRKQVSSFQYPTHSLIALWNISSSFFPPLLANTFFYIVANIIIHKLTFCFFSNFTLFEIHFYAAAPSSSSKHDLLNNLY